ncbi:hypothetical protein PG985_007835 [Apiospora marii]|uniref:Uncharacterized protein n=1 Tax=Apiospora marii TaxID=335849 RepID=A0ABR1SPY5_9PEZI
MSARRIELDDLLKLSSTSPALIDVTAAFIAFIRTEREQNSYSNKYSHSLDSSPTLSLNPPLAQLINKHASLCCSILLRHLLLNLLTASLIHLLHINLNAFLVALPSPHLSIVAYERSKRIIANCEIIWGKDSVYDLGEEGNFGDDYFVFVREELGTEYGPLLMFAQETTSDEAWNRLDRILSLKAWKTQTERGPPMVVSPLSLAGPSSPFGQNQAHRFGELTQKLQ